VNPISCLYLHTFIKGLTLVDKSEPVGPDSNREVDTQTPNNFFISSLE